MKKKFALISIPIMMACILFPSCGMGNGDQRDCNLKQVTLMYLDSVPDVEYIGMSDIKDLDDDRFQAVIIYYVSDSDNNRIEHNARLITNDDCTKILSWEDLESSVLEDTKQEISDKMHDKGINLDVSLIDALINLKKR